MLYHQVWFTKKTGLPCLLSHESQMQRSNGRDMQAALIIKPPRFDAIVNKKQQEKCYWSSCWSVMVHNVPCTITTQTCLPVLLLLLIWK